jgi:hypothetical protein
LTTGSPAREAGRLLAGPSPLGFGFSCTRFMPGLLVAFLDTAGNSSGQQTGKKPVLRNRNYLLRFRFVKNLAFLFLMLIDAALLPRNLSSHLL